MEHVKWILPDLAEDHTVHFLYECEKTLCGLAYEGVQGGTEQGFKVIKKKVTCDQCICIVQASKAVRDSEMQK